MFRGQYVHSISDSGRVSIPAKFRELLNTKYSSTTIIISMLENCLLAYPIVEWEKLEAKMIDLPSFKKETVDFERYLIGNASECQLDSEGRINISPVFRKNLNFKKSVVFVGILTRFEIWDQKSWQKNKELGFKKFQKSRDHIDEI